MADPATAVESGRATPSAEQPPRLAFNMRLDTAIEMLGTLLCVGLDPRAGEFEGARADFCRRIIDMTFDAAVAYKPNSAFFEAAGPQGMAELELVIRHVAGERVVILDAKRGDIGSTAEAYAQASFRVLGADAVTVNPYLGGDAVAPFLADAVHGAFVLCHTSNPGALDFQALDVGGRPLYLEVARRADEWNRQGNVGLVVGATYPDALAAVRGVAPSLPVLVPGVGAQGGELAAALAAGLDQRGRGLLITSSRGILRAADPRDAALRLRDELNAFRARSRQ